MYRLGLFNLCKFYACFVITETCFVITQAYFVITEAYFVITQAYFVITEANKVKSPFPPLSTKQT